jgi:hypothetical protein
LLSAECGISLLYIIEGLAAKGRQRSEMPSRKEPCSHKVQNKLGTNQLIHQIKCSECSKILYMEYICQVDQNLKNTFDRRAINEVFEPEKPQNPVNEEMGKKGTDKKSSGSSGEHVTAKLLEMRREQKELGDAYAELAEENERLKAALFSCGFFERDM